MCSKSFYDRVSEILEKKETAVWIAYTWTLKRCLIRCHIEEHYENWNT